MKGRVATVFCFLLASIITTSAFAQATSTINGSPLTIHINDVTSFQVINSQVGTGGNIFSPNENTNPSSGVFAQIGGTLFGPFLGTTWTPVSISPVLGTGTSSDPFTINVVVAAGTTGVQLTQTVTYVQGELFFRQTYTITNTGVAVPIDVFLGADLYLGGSDSGVGVYQPSSGSVGGTNCAGAQGNPVGFYNILFIPITPADRYAEANYSTIYSQITSGTLTNTIDPNCLDNGAALQWSSTLAAGGTTTILAAVSFGPVPTIASFRVDTASPNQANPGQTLTVDLTGIGFQAGTTFDFGAGISVTSTSIQSPSQATVGITVSTTAAPGFRNITATETPNGRTSTLSNGFEVTGPSGSDLSIVKSGPARVTSGSAAQYTLTITNLGSGTATGVSVTDTFSPGLIFESVGAPCGGFPCSVGDLAAGATATITANFTAVFSGSFALFNTATVSSTSADSDSSNNSSSVATAICPDSAPTLVEPVNGAVLTSTLVTFRYTTPFGTASYQLYAVDPSSTQPPVFLGSSTTGEITADVPTGTSDFYVIGFPVNEACGARESSRIRLSAPGCPEGPPQLLEPSPEAVLSQNPVTFTFTAVVGAVRYEVYVLTGPTATPTLIGSTTTTTLTADVPQGSFEAYVEAIGASELCSRTRSAAGRRFTQNACLTSAPTTAPMPAIPGESASTETYEFSWTLEGALDSTTYEVQESLDERFTSLVSTPIIVTGNKAAFAHDVARATGYFYQVRVINNCQGQSFLGPFSVVVRIVVQPRPAPLQPQPDQTQQFGLPDPLVQQLFIVGDDDSAPGARGGAQSLGNTSKPFTVSTSQPWLTVSPVSGVVPPQGVVVTVTAQPVGLPVGTNTGTVAVSSPSPTGGSTPISNTPIAVNLVTPVTPTPKGSAPPQNALFIPSVSHLEGIRASYQSDVRIANTSSQKVSYQISFTPSRVDGTNIGKQTLLDIEAGATTALDDIVKRLYGLGSLADGTLGSLEIRPLGPAGDPQSPEALRFATVASSRTYNQTLNGSLSQFVPATPFADFVFKGTGPSSPTRLSMQQIAQSDKFRTNLGLVEGSGEAATAQVTVFGLNGAPLDTFLVALKPSEHVQLTSVLAGRGINLEEGRIEVELISNTGKITAFATVIDTRSGDPILVPSVQLSKLGASRYVVPGIAHISNDRNQWRSQMRLFNAGSSTEVATLTFIPANDPINTRSSTVTIAPGEVKALENVAETLFGTNVVGAVHVTTPMQSALVVTARTYDTRLGGEVSQFTSAVTPNDASGLADRPLQILQLEESDRFRTNLGLAEVAGDSAELEIIAIVPGATVAPVLRLTLRPTEFRQISRILAQMGLSEAYNARLSIRVLSGAGRIAAYGSVIDNITQDPYNVPAQ